MDVSTFDDMCEEFMQRMTAAVYCSMATVDGRSRPRSRILHSIWDGPIGWVISWPQSHKARHLRANPFVSLAYIHDKDKPVYVDCQAEWVDDEGEQRRIWELHKATPLLGFDPQPHYGTIHGKYFGLLRFTPWRVELGNLGGEPLIWRRQTMIP